MGAGSALGRTGIQAGSDQSWTRFPALEFPNTHTGSGRLPRYRMEAFPGGGCIECRSWRFLRRFVKEGRRGGVEKPSGNFEGMCARLRGLRRGTVGWDDQDFLTLDDQHASFAEDGRWDCQLLEVETRLWRGAGEANRKAR